MAKLKGPLFSMDARGSIGKALTFAYWKGISYVREWFMPQNPQTQAQQNVRDIFALSVLRWQNIGDPNQATWEAHALDAGKTQSGFNFFVSEYVKDMLAGEEPADAYS